MLYLQISLSIEGLIFATRVPEAPCYSSAPVWSLVVSVLVANVLVTVIVGLGLLGKEVAINDLVIVWAYDVVWFGIIDLLKIPSAGPRGEPDSSCEASWVSVGDRSPRPRRG